MPGYEIFRGNSWIDGAPIVAIATTNTENRKTGDMVQTWILRADIDPVRAVAGAADASICGNCPHRGEWSDDLARMINRSCYVNIGQAPRSVYMAWQRGAYPRIGSDRLAVLMHGQAVRLGAYGDPALLPARILRALTVGARLHTGYTHQWRDPRAAHARRVCMASCDSAQDVTDATAAGWRAFHVGADAPAGAITCPASDEYEARTGRRTTCAECGLCGGNTRAGLPVSPAVARVVTIRPHGSGATHALKRVSLTIGAT